ncbi:MAG: hypothetical protein ACK2UL_05005 [Anaerolineae bacterium]
MTASLLALAAAVATVVVYAVLADRMDYATVHRRQLDVWAALAGFACLTTILYGAADVRRSSAARAGLDGIDGQSPEIVYRQEAVVLEREPAAVDTGDYFGDTVVIIEPGTQPGTVDQAAASPGGGPVTPLEADAYSDPRPDGRVWATDQPLVLVEDAVDSRGVYTPALGTDPQSSPTPTVGQIVIVATEKPAEPRYPTAPPPTQVPPTDAPAPRATATPHCGDPEDIEVGLEVAYARLLEGRDPQTVEYRAQVVNRSVFPVKLVDILVTIESQDVGAEQFGHAARQDVMVEPSVLFSLDGDVELKKSPSPFGTTQLCVSFVTETCGRSVPYQVTKRCLAVDGF